MKKKRLIIRSAVILLLVGLAVWRLWPRSIDSFMNYPSRDTDRVYCYLTVCDVENGRAVNRTYKLDAENERESRGQAI